MGSETLALTVLITARDLASPILAAMGDTGLAAINPLTLGASVLAATIVGIGAASIHAATAFDQNMHKIQALTDTNGEQLAYYKQQILTLGPSLDMSADQMSKALVA